ncbi:choline sulfate utilization transcriptional regulator [Chthonobacter rhizosphaerae]|uniref:choline sulfate utilization transcriptional regulator n=1 Tax=Chthonobacter rhizosphaerae TaxID=2735553 RepID=UPI0015EE5C77|nr:LysR substrate-binding domain-containing protein [Chthonobacter rhizosphaerae]
MAERPLDLAWMRVFEAVGRLGSLTAAAAELKLSQPAVSYAVRQLEGQIGAPLLARGHRGSALTPSGRLLFRAVQGAVTEIDGATREIRSLNRRPIVRLFTDYGFASLWMMPRVAAFRSVCPEAEVHIVASSAAEPGGAEGVDIAVLFGLRSDFPTSATQLYAERVVPVCSPAFAAVHRLGDDPRALTRTPLLHLDSTPHPRWFTWRDWLAATGVERSPGPGDLSLNTYGLVVQAAIADQGLALGWSGLVDGALADGSLVAVGPPLTRTESGYFMVEASARSATARILARFIAEEAGRAASVGSGPAA